MEGNYTFTLTVVDADGAKNSTNATLEVLKETDYPPEANAGAPVVIYLPQNNLTLNGNASTDDHGIVSWEWTLVSDDSKNGASGSGTDQVFNHFLHFFKVLPRGPMNRKGNLNPVRFS